MFYCMFYFTCDRSLITGDGHLHVVRGRIVNRHSLERRRKFTDSRERAWATRRHQLDAVISDRQTDGQTKGRTYAAKQATF